VLVLVLQAGDGRPPVAKKAHDGQVAVAHQRGRLGDDHPQPAAVRRGHLMDLVRPGRRRLRAFQHELAQMRGHDDHRLQILGVVLDLCEGMGRILVGGPHLNSQVHLFSPAAGVRRLAALYTGQILVSNTAKLALHKRGNKSVRLGVNRR
jgi:hypothetical protein